jgi:hypothetical protein
MSTQMATKVTYFLAALVMNSLLALGVGALFDAQVQAGAFASTSVVQSSHEGA